MSYNQSISEWCGLRKRDTLTNFTLNETELKYFKTVAELAMEQFYIENPYTNDLTSEIFEKALFYRYNNCFYKLPTDEIVLCTYVPNNQFTRYMKPSKVNLFYFNGVSIATNVDYEDIVPIRDNAMDIPPYIVVMQYMRQLAIADKTFDINMINMRFPFFFKGDKKQQGALNKIYENISEFKPIVFTDKDGLGTQDIETIDTTKLTSPVDVYDVIKELKNQALQCVGVYSDTGKKERLLVSEVATQTDFVDMTYQARKRNRLEAIEEANRRWGGNMILKETYADIREENAEYTAQEVEAQQGDNEVGDNNGRN